MRDGKTHDYATKYLLQRYLTLQFALLINYILTVCFIKENVANWAILSKNNIVCKKNGQ